MDANPNLFYLNCVNGFNAFFDIAFNFFRKFITIYWNFQLFDKGLHNLIMLIQKTHIIKIVISKIESILLRKRHADKNHIGLSWRFEV